MGFLPEPFFLLLDGHALTMRNTIISIPYIQGTSETVRRILNETGVKVAIKPVRTIGRLLLPPKDPRKPEKKSSLIYQVPCFDCDFVHIGQTKRVTFYLAQVDYQKSRNGKIFF